ncbi:MAG: hypothetical protein PHQ30_03380 [Candidatus Izemoplasmatales bacterium]|nr:hypothetical protein [Candidatus Izemoplasmatales bacterium]
MNETNAFVQKIKAKKTLWQFIKFTVFSTVTTVVDLGSFALFNYLIFTSLANQEFKFWLLDYSINAGGLCAFLSFALSFVISQTFNFFIQRKATFKATNNALYSGIMYAIMIIIVFIFQLWMPTIVRGPLSNLVGDTWGDLITKNINMTISFAIQFPMNKWVIMREVKPKIIKE